ncbi:ribose-5-phosphate isomerase RpiA [Archaeoglobus veneficus]|uniref:Ribose-5-phosphate isomerase A n=1 Tax=Archaeoglobus veneficus (strain DSM 11195 / SNP6) TaxID=693661 RepID=F2KNC4_ARCVS|nr:ribose-5-phosphate isomerase RpiA [Archaeoglobus veneficus]AEA47326.1 Ribose-5-phosphate isomerase A [Archaeoglobus veneficus SNP6]
MSNGKANAAKKAVELVRDGAVIGIGSGTTVEIFLRELGRRIENEGLTVYGVPSSYQSHILATNNGIKVVDLIQYPELDICIDGADQVDERFNCIKGGGGALTREKIVAAASKEVVIIVDSSKIVDRLNMPVPIEVLPFAYGFVERRLSAMGRPVLREGSGKLGPVVTDNGNFIIDCDFGDIDKPEELEREIDRIPGVVECGIFCSELIDGVIAGYEDGARFLKK